MMEWIETRPAVDVRPSQYQRLLGYPRDVRMEGRSAELAEWALAWYGEHGRPWVYARTAESTSVDGTTVEIENVRFRCESVSRRFQRAAASGAVLAAVSAGPELEHEAQQRWRAEKPDEYYFLEALGSAVVERLTAMLGERLCTWAEGRGEAALSHYSPGYPGWDIADQSRLLELLTRSGRATTLPGPIEALESGALRPKKSLLALFGIARNTASVRLTDVLSCETCSMASCQFRRKPFRK